MIRSDLVLAWCLVAPLVGAQARPVQARVPAERIALALRPYPGDTIRVRVVHEVDESGTVALPSGDSTVRVRTATTVVLRSAVQSMDAAGALVTATVESVTVRATGGKDESRRAREAAADALRGRSLRLRLASDGGIAMLDSDADATLTALVDRVPAALPTIPVAVGTRWTRAMQLAGAPGDGLQAEFRLDSLTHLGDHAWVSVRGTMRDPEVQAGATVVGWLVLDRRRGWIVKSRLSMTMQSVTTARSGMPPMRYAMRVEQRVAEVDQR
jgi:hypothetical protein